MTGIAPALGHQAGPFKGLPIEGRKGERTRNRLIDATAELLGQRRVQDLRVAEIARTAATSPATFYVYFADVSDALLAAVEALSLSPPNLLQLFATPWGRADAVQRSDALIRQYVAFWDDHRALLRARNLASEQGDTRFILARQRGLRPLLDAIEAQATRAQRDAMLPTGLNPGAVAGALMAMLDRLAATMPIYFGEAGAINAERTIDREAMIASAAHIFAATLADNG